MIIEFEQWADEVRALVDEDPYGRGLIEVIDRAGIDVDRTHVLDSLKSQGWRIFASQEGRLVLGYHGHEGALREPTGRQLIVITKRPEPPILVSPDFVALSKLLGCADGASWQDLALAISLLKSDRESFMKRVVDLNSELAVLQHKFGERGLELDRTHTMLRNTDEIAKRYAAELKRTRFQLSIAASHEQPELREGWMWRREGNGWHADASDATVAWEPGADKPRSTSHGTTDYGAGGPDDVHEAVRRRNVLEGLLDGTRRVLAVDARNTPETRERIRKFLASNMNALLVLEADEKPPQIIDDAPAFTQDWSKVIVRFEPVRVRSERDSEGNLIITAFSRYSLDGVMADAHAPINPPMPQAGIVATRVAQENALARHLAEARVAFESTIAPPPSPIALHVHDEIIVDVPVAKPHVQIEATIAERIGEAFKRVEQALEQLCDMMRERVLPAVQRAFDAIASIDDLDIFEAYVDYMIDHATGAPERTRGMWGTHSFRRTLSDGDPWLTPYHMLAASPPEGGNASTTEARGLAVEAADYRGTESGRVRTRVCGKHHPSSSVTICKLAYQHAGTCTDGKRAWFDTADGKAPQCMHTLVDGATQTECQLASDHYGDHVDQNERRWSNKLSGSPERMRTQTLPGGGTVVGPYTDAAIVAPWDGSKPVALYDQGQITAAEVARVIDRVEGYSAHVDENDRSRVHVVPDGTLSLDGASRSASMRDAFRMQYDSDFEGLPRTMTEHVALIDRLRAKQRERKLVLGIDPSASNDETGIVVASKSPKGDFMIIKNGTHTFRITPMTGEQELSLSRSVQHTPISPEQFTDFDADLDPGDDRPLFDPDGFVDEP